MKIASAINTNYSNRKQQNFGMILDFDEAAIRLLHRGWFNNIQGQVSGLRTRPGEELTIKGKGKGQNLCLQIPRYKNIYTIAQKDLGTKLLATLKRINNSYI